MDELLSEKEQIDAMRSWWKDNGAYVVMGIVIGVGGIFGLNQWRSSQTATQMEASTLFEELAEEIAENRLEPAEALASSMHTDYGATIYADQARLAMARLYMDQGRDEDAAAELTALLDGGAEQQMKMVARLRLAKVLLYQDKAEEVLALLKDHTDSGFAARYNEALGDAHAQLGAHKEAEEAYLAALGDPLASQLVDTSLLQMKISDLPDELAAGTVITPAGAAESTDEPAMDEPAMDAAGRPAPDTAADESDPENDGESTE